MSSSRWKFLYGCFVFLRSMGKWNFCASLLLLSMPSQLVFVCRTSKLVLNRPENKKSNEERRCRMKDQLPPGSHSRLTFRLNECLKLRAIHSRILFFSHRHQQQHQKEEIGLRVEPQVTWLEEFLKCYLRKVFSDVLESVRMNLLLSPSED